MRYVAKCLRELAFVAFRCGKYEDVPKHLEAAAELDRRAKKVIIENRYSDDQPRDDRGRWTDGGGSGGFVSGATSGALNPYSKRAQEHADRYYESVRHMKNDTQRIADATGIKKDKINKIKQHIFIKEHDLWDGHRRFDSSYEMALSWQRLIDGKRILPKDIILLKHEYMELRYMEKGLTQDEAHIKASKRYNYAKYCE